MRRMSLRSCLQRDHAPDVVILAVVHLFALDRLEDRWDTLRADTADGRGLRLAEPGNAVLSRRASRRRRPQGAMIRQPPVRLCRPAGGYTLSIWMTEMPTVRLGSGYTWFIWMKEMPPVKLCRPAGVPSLPMHWRGVVGWQDPGSVSIVLSRAGLAVITAHKITSLILDDELVRGRCCAG